MNTVPTLPPPYLQQLVLENVSDIIVTTDLQFNIQSWNHIAEQFYGKTAQAVLGKPITEVLNFTYHDVPRDEAVRELMEHRIWQGLVSFTGVNGETYYFLQTVKYVLNEAGQELGIMAVGRNITEYRRTEEKLGQSENFYRTLIAHSLDLMLLMNAQGEITFSSPSILQLLGYRVEEVMGTNGFQYIHPDDLAWATESFEREVEKNPEIKFIIVRLLKKNGEWLWCMVRGHNLLHVPHVHAMVIYIHDDTPRKKASEAIKQSEKQFRTLISDLQVGVLLQDAHGKILMTNSAMARMFEMPESAIVGGKIWELYDDVIHEDGRRFLLSERPSFKVIQTGQLVKDVVMGVWHPRRQERIWILVSADPVMDAQGQLQNIVCSFTDITERKKLEKKSMTEKIAHQKQLAQATIDGQEQERLEIGRELHDNIGQQLTSIKLFLDLAKNTAVSDNTALVETALKSVINVINEVRSLSRSLVPSSLKDLGFLDSVNDLIESLRTTQIIRFKVDCTDFDENTLPDNKKLALFRIVQEQLNNIVKHASAENVSVTLSVADGQITLSIIDDGIGFHPENVRRGLGFLNISNRAELCGGQANITSAPGKGCTLRICLPHTAEGSVCQS